MVKTMNKLLKVKCPQCNTVFPYYDSEFRPFCCERCKMIDLGHWFEETYKVPVKEVVKPDTQKEEKVTDEKANQEVENADENSYDEYTQIDEEIHDENDY